MAVLRERDRRGADSTVASADLISKVYFPRLDHPASRRWRRARRLRASAFVVVVGAMLVFGVDRRRQDPAAAAAGRCSPLRAGARHRPVALGAQRPLPRHPAARAVPDAGLACSSRRSSIRSSLVPSSAAAALRAQPAGRRARALSLDALRRAPTCRARSSLIPLSSARRRSSTGALFFERAEQQLRRRDLSAPMADRSASRRRQALPARGADARPTSARERARHGAAPHDRRRRAGREAARAATTGVLGAARRLARRPARARPSG